MIEDNINDKNEKKEKRYQELSMPYRIVMYVRWMPIGYIKGLAWYFVKRLRWEDVSDDEKGRISLDTCIGICVGMVQTNMRWYYTSEEVFGEDGYIRKDTIDEGFLDKIGNFLEDKLVEIVDGKVYRMEI